MKPLAIDLFCGLRQPEGSPRANPAIKQFVAGGAEYPNHVTLGVGNDAPCAVSLVLRLVRHLKNAIFSAGFAGRGKVRAAPPKPANHAVLKWASRIVDL